MRVLITGAAGALGRDAVPLLAERHDVRATDLAPASPPCEFVQADLRDDALLPGLVAGVDAVVHLAALLPLDYSAKQFAEVNAAATTSLMAAAAEAGVEHFVYISTIWATGHGPEEGVWPITADTPPKAICLYGHTKYLGEVSGEYFARNSAMRVTILRFCGYERCAEIGPDGAVEWASVDWPRLVFAAARPMQKLFDPVDLADALEAALGLGGKLSRWIVGLNFPFGPDDQALLQEDPAAAWERRSPGTGRLFAALGVNPPDLPFLYDTHPFCEATGWRPRLSLPAIARRYLGLHGDKL